MFGFGLASKAAKYAVYVALCCIIYKACDKCCTRMCKKRDPWNITEEIQGDEIAAGHVFKPDGMLGFWGEYYLVVKDNRLILYADQTRTAVRAEYTIAGATAERCATRADEEDKCYYFTLSHPDQGVREFYASSSPRRDQWIEVVNRIAGELRSGGKCLFGSLYKIGGITKTIWEERYCVCTGPTLVYYVNKTDDLPGGTLFLVGANIRDVSHRGKKHSIEIIQDPSAKASRKGKKKYYFATENQAAQNQWLECLKRSASTSQVDGEGSTTTNPLQQAAGGSSNTDGGGIAMVSMERPKTSIKGLLEKRQRRMGSFQKRYWVLDPGEKNDIKLLYFDSKEIADKNGGMKGFIPLAEISKADRPKRDGATDFTFSCRSKLYTLRAPTPQDRDEWVMEMNKWIDFACVLKDHGGRLPSSSAPPP